MVEFRFLALENYTNKPFVTEWSPMEDGTEMNKKYFELDLTCHDIRIETRNIEEGSDTVNKVKGYRTMIGKSQEEMAEVLGVHVNTYRQMEENPKKFRIDQAAKFVEEIKKYDSSISIADIFS